MDQSPRPLPERYGWVLRLADQVTLIVILIVCLVMLGVRVASQRVRHGPLIDLERTAPLPYEFVVDVNEAQWPELSLLPGIGETLAKRIVESRSTDGPYRKLSDLRRVKGIGPRKLDQIEPYLDFDTD